MHTDEYEITTHREMILCRKAIDRLKASMRKREEECGMSPDAILKALEQDGAAERNPHLRNWREECVELEIWEKRLRDYEESLQILKGI
ncbi:MAG: hypothetical protein LLF99_17050 [Desulfobacteraceae bacterium]|nr:hypothetical protein [Desulfobacteraceae bacterium]